MTYERILELNEEDTADDRKPKTHPSEVLQISPSRHEITEEELKLCFRRLTLTAPAPPKRPLNPQQTASWISIVWMSMRIGKKQTTAH